MQPHSASERKTICVLEDDPGCRFVYEDILALRYRVVFADTIASFRQLIEETGLKPDLLIADIRLPDDDFIAHLDLVRCVGIPFMVVSSIDDLDVLRTCFRDGAIDYITKPFGRSELVVKLERIFSSRLPMEDLHFDFSRMQVRRGHTSIQLTAKELQILSLIHSGENRQISREEILTRVWGGVRIGMKTLDVHIFNLRKKLDRVQARIEYDPPHTYTLHL